ncbi:MAG: methyltransferase [Chloroflexota bacterium]|nr:methyltransferase [Chloroflexota bacterium]
MSVDGKDEGDGSWFRAAVGGAPAPGQRLSGHPGGPCRHHARDRGPPGRRTTGSDDLARATGTHPGALYRLLRALAGAGVMREEEGGRFALTDLGDCLRTDVPESLAGWTAFVGEPYHWQVWGDLLHSVQTGEDAFHHVHGTDPWSYRARHPERSARFDRAMAAVSRQVAAAILATYDFGRFGTVVDIAGGTGTFLAAILARHATMQGVLFDLPHVVAGAEPILTAAGVTDRCAIVEGSFFEAVPAGGDAYILKAILHDWDDEDCLRILHRCRRAMTDGASLLAVERELGPPNESPDGKFSDLNMLVATGGRERSPEEYGVLFASAGFRFVGFTPSASGTGVFEGVAA